MSDQLPGLVVKKLADYPPLARSRLIALRSLILSVAEKHKATMGPMIETLKWNELAYLPEKPHVGTTVRIDWKPKTPDKYFVYVNCKTNLIDRYKELFSAELRYEGERSIVLNLEEEIPKVELSHAIYMAFTYHLENK